MGGRVEVRVVLCARQVLRREEVVEAGRVRVRRWEIMGRVIGAPVHKSLCSLAGFGGGVGSGWRSSRFGNSSLFSGMMTVLVR